jgi:hypothetical protein
MERRYLAATLALAATFAVFSGEFCTRYLDKVPHSRAELKADLAFAKHYVAKELMAKLESYVGQDDSTAAPEPMLADLTAPELLSGPETAIAPERPKCPAAVRGRKAPQAVIELRAIGGDKGRGWSDLSVVRAELLSERAQEWQKMANQHAIEINVRALEQAQSDSAKAFEQALRDSARAQEQARRDMEKSRVKVSVPVTTGTAMHINFVVPTVNVSPVAPEPPTLSIY